MNEIPNGWQRCLLREIAVERYGLVDGPFGSNLSSSEYVLDGVPVIRGINLSLGNRPFFDDGYVFVTIQKADELIRSNCFPGDIIFTKKGTVGQTGIIPPDAKYTRYVLSSNQMKLQINPAIAENYYIYYYVSSPSSRSRFIDDASSTGVPQINLGYLKSFPVLLPPLPEQRIIAAILSTWDEAITLTERLIAVLRQRKQALMQMLLTGEVRFPGFEGEWRRMTLEDATRTMESGGTPSTQTKKFWDGNIPWITGADFEDQKVSQVRRYITAEAVEKSSTKVVNKGNILLVTRTGVGKMALAPFDMAISQDITGITPKEEIITPEYLIACLSWTIPRLARFNQGTSINGIIRNDLKVHEIVIPHFKEQQKITNVLQICDSQIEQSKQIFISLQLEKRGLMQQLLTGAIRVQVEE